MNRLLLAIGGLLVGLLALMFAVPAMVDWNKYRGVFEEEATRLLGREVRVGGAINLRLLPTPYVRIEKVRVADTTGGIGRPLFAADDFTVWLSVGGLLSGALDASDIEVRRPVVTLVLDGKGGGNWSSLAEPPVRSTFTPARMAFNAVRITDGMLAIVGADGTPKTEFKSVSGEFSAQALEGPYRLAATYAIGTASREIRLSTAKPAEDRSVRFKGTVRDPSSGVSYSLDGLARDVLGKVAVEGDLHARLPLPAALVAKATGATAGAAPDAKSGPGEFDVRAALKGDTTGFTLRDLALSFEQDGRPQLATGSAQVSWVGATEVKVELASQWLDLDRIAGAGLGAGPVELAQGLALGISRVLATDGRTEASVSLEQATLGGDVISGLSAELEQMRGRLAIRRLAAALPGGARFSASGAFEGDASDFRYTGRLDLRGASLARFAAWAARDRTFKLPARDGPFAASGDVVLGKTEVAGEALTLQVGRNTMTGRGRWRTAGRHAIEIDLDGSELDATPFVEDGQSPLQAVASAFTSGTDGKGGGLQNSDVAMKLRFGKVLAGAVAYRDAHIDLAIAGGNLSVPRLRVVSDAGYEVDVRGDVASVTLPEAKGAISGLVAATSSQGAKALALSLGLPVTALPEEEWRAVTGLRLAGRFGIGERGAGTRDYGFDGVVAGSRLAGTVRLGPGAQRWQERNADVAATLTGPKVARLVARLAGSTGTEADGAGQAGQMTATVRAVGRPRDGLATLISLDGSGLESAYTGLLTIDDTGAVGLDGEIVAESKAIERTAPLFGLTPKLALAGPVSGRIKLARKGSRVQLSTDSLVVLGSPVAGSIAIDGSEGARRVSGDLKLGRISVPGVLAAISTSGRPSRSGDERPSAWSEGALDIGITEGLVGSRLRVEVGQLALSPGLEAREARLDVSVRPGGLDVRVGDAKALGGLVAGVIALDKAPAGTRLAIEGTIAGVHLDKLIGTDAGRPVVSGTGALSLKMQSVALSPRGLIVGLGGTGEVSLSQVRLSRWNPEAINAAANAVFAQRGEVPEGMLRQQLTLALGASGAALGSAKLPVIVADGTLKPSPWVVTTATGRLTGRASADLDKLTFDAQWRIEPRNTPKAADLPEKPELPAITIDWSGELASVSAAAARIDLDALEREVTVRKVEREVIELERLRKLDEERARQDAERRAREAEELERAKREAAAQAAVPREPPTQLAPPSPNLPPAAPAAATGATTPLSAGAAVTPPGTLPALQAAPTPVERAPLPKASAAPPPKKARRDPFSPLREGSP